MIKKIGLKQAGLIYILMNIITIMVHLMVILKLLPYTWINGGRSAAFEIARQTSIGSIPYFIIGIPIILIACGVIHIKRHNIFKKIFTVFLWLIAGYTCLGFIMQLLGTPFEKFFMSIVCAVSAIMLIRLAIGNSDKG